MQDNKTTLLFSSISGECIFILFFKKPDIYLKANLISTEYQEYDLNMYNYLSLYLVLFYWAQQ